MDPAQDAGDSAAVSRPLTPRGRIISTRALGAALALALLAAGLPFVGAALVSTRRFETARRQAQALALALQQSPITDTEEVLVGPGSLPRFQGEAWPDRKADLKARVPGIALQADPWRNAYVVNLGGRGAACVISAGPNGIVETPFHDALRAGGDDVVAAVRAERSR